MAKREAKKGGIGGELGKKTEKLTILISKYGELVSVLVLLAIVALGLYVRILPALNYGLELDANDPWIAYWEAKYFVDNGLFNTRGLEDVKTFWWPTGRDILHGDYIGLAWLAAATYPIGKAFGLTLKEWIALFPVFAGVANIVLAYLLVRLVTGSRLGGLVSSTLFALLPGSIVRTKVGFVEKTGFASPFLTAFYLFLFLAVKSGDYRRRIVYAVLAGIFGGSVAFLWGGYHLVALSLAMAILLDPLFEKPNIERLRTYMIAVVSYAIVTVASPKVGLSYFFTGIGAAITIAVVIYLAEVYVDKLPIIGGLIEITPRFQAWLIIVILLAGGLAVYSQAVGVNARLLATVGIRHISPLVESVQENQPASLRMIMMNYGVALILAVVGVLILVAEIVQGRRDARTMLPKAIVYFMTFFMFYANLQLSYFTQAASYYATLAAGFATADIVRGAIAPSTGKKSRRHEAGDPLRILAAGFIVAIVGISAAYYGRTSLAEMKYSAPQILTSGLGALSVADPNTGERHIVVPLNKAWLNALEWIRNNTSQDALIVSWWDYGYWITVNTGRKTIADGSTYNETQIRFLARVLTGTEGEATYILRNIFKAEPNNTYVVFYEVFRGIVDTQNNVLFLYPIPTFQPLDRAGRTYFVAHGQADFQKSSQMLRIAYRVDPFGNILDSNYVSFTVDNLGRKYYHFPGFVGEPKHNVETVRNALIYKMAINGIAAIPRVAVTDEATCGNLLQNVTASIMGVAKSSINGQLQFEYLLPTGMDFFKPVAVSISCPIVNQVQNGYSILAVVVFIYQWTG